MKPIDEYQQVRDGLFYWSAFDPAVKADLSCCAVATPAGLVLVDPLPLAEEPLEEMTSRLTPVAVVLTNANHQRDSVRFGERFGVPVFAHAAARGEITADEWLEEGSVIAEVLELIHLPGFAPGEMALAGNGLMIMGDALINLEPHGFSILPEKYCIDREAGREALRKLLHHSFEVMTFAHGSPLVVNAAARLNALLP